jgi:hypothetical protein
MTHFTVYFFIGVEDMMNKAERKQLYNNIEKRILAGEHKSKIYAEYPDEQDSKLVARLLVQIPTPARRKQFSLLNWILVVAIGILTAINLVVITLLVLTETPKGVVLILIVPTIINIYLIWAIAKFRGVGYVLVIVFGLNGLSNTMEGFGVETIHHVAFAINVIGFVCIIASIVIAFVLMKKLLPQTIFWLTPKKDESGRPIFEE